jgi:hypothetical protein
MLFLFFSQKKIKIKLSFLVLEKDFKLLSLVEFQYFFCRVFSALEQIQARL